MKYYRNPIKIENPHELEDPCENCPDEFEKVFTGEDELGEYIEINKCTDTCPKRELFLEQFWHPYTTEFISEKQMKRLKEISKR